MFIEDLFLKKKIKKPTLDWPNQIPIEGYPKDVTEIVKKYSLFFKNNNIPTNSEAPSKDRKVVILPYMAKSK